MGSRVYVALVVLILGAGAAVWQRASSRPKGEAFVGPAEGSVTSVTVKIGMKRRTFEGADAEKIRRLFTPAYRLPIAYRWVYFGDVELKTRDKGTTTLSVWFSRVRHLGYFGCNGVYYECARLDQLDDLMDMVGEYGERKTTDAR